METYTLLREFADSWMLLALTLVFVVVIGWAYRPGSRAKHDDAARMIFRNDKAPETGDPAVDATRGHLRPSKEPLT